MVNQNYFTRRILIKAPIDKVFDSWAIQGQMEEWFLLSAVYKRGDHSLEVGDSALVNDQYEWIWHGWPENVQKGKVLKVEKNEIFSFSFDPAGNVEVSFEQMENQNVLISLTQEKIPLEEQGWYNYFYGCSLGWSFWLVNLKAYLEHGIVLDHREGLFDRDQRMEVVNQ